MSHKFKPGDVVELNSGGPPMTVVGFVRDKPDVAVCSWLDGTDQFHIATLKKVETLR